MCLDFAIVSTFHCQFKFIFSIVMVCHVLAFQLPVIDWSSYNVTVPTDSLKPLTRKDSNRHAGTSLDSVMNTEHDSCDLKSKILVRGRPFDDSKPETFNQVCTTCRLK